MNYREKRTDLKISRNCSPKIKNSKLNQKMCVLYNRAVINWLPWKFQS